MTTDTPRTPDQWLMITEREAHNAAGYIDHRLRAVFVAARAPVVEELRRVEGERDELQERLNEATGHASEKSAERHPLEAFYPITGDGEWAIPGRPVWILPLLSDKELNGLKLAPITKATVKYVMLHTDRDSEIYVDVCENYKGYSPRERTFYSYAEAELALAALAAQPGEEGGNDE